MKGPRESTLLHDPQHKGGKVRGGAPTQAEKYHMGTRGTGGEGNQVLKIFRKKKKDWPINNSKRIDKVY